MKEYQLIKETDYEYNADLGLSYASPVRGVWNIVHIGTLVPESHEIFVCPTSCLRGVVLTTAEMEAMDRLSTITVGEDNILEGDMEEALYRGTVRIIRELPVKPRAMLIYTSCIHHFMAVNYKRIYRLLEKEYPEIDFIDCYMDPIMRRTAPAVPSLWRQIHRLLTPSEKNTRQVNLVGNCFPYGPYSDLNYLLEREGIRVMDLNTCRSYEEFLQMSRSVMNFVFHKTGIPAVKDMKVRLGQDWMLARPGYNYDEIDADLAQAASLLEIPPFTREEIEEERRRTDQSAAEALEVLRKTPVSLDYTAVDRPLELCLYLDKQGFRVESVFIDVFTESEEIFQELKKRLPDLKIYQSLGWNIRQMKRGHEGKVVSIGQKSAYFNDTDYFVNIVENDGMYGYRGIRRLMELLKEAALSRKPMKELVQIKGWGCSCG
ncbi:MAG: nitrogenase [Parasporobacterium sp.]|nr:nitrogenase [Parasporobacterium sp.]